MVKLLYVSDDAARLEIVGRQQAMVELLNGRLQRAEHQTPQSDAYKLGDHEVRVACGQVIVSAHYSDVQPVLEQIYAWTGRPVNEAEFTPNQW